jgi:predicted chitinase
VFYSVYAHLKKLGDGIAVGQKIYRKDKLGKPGQIYGHAGHLHFEICLDDANIKLLLGQDPSKWPAQDAVPSKNGRTDAVFGSVYVYLPPDSAAYDTKEPPLPYSRSLAVPNALPAAQWVELDYGSKPGDAVLRSYTATGQAIGSPVTDKGAEYELYSKATHLHDNLPAHHKAKSSPSAWYEFLRFGRNLGTEQLPVQAPHWRNVATPLGVRWVNLAGPGTYQFSDADFPAFLGWTCIADDKNTDQFCESSKLKNLIASSVPDLQKRAEALKDLQKLGRLAQTSAKSILRKAICKYPTEFDRGNIDARYGYIKNEEYFKKNSEAWGKLRAHISAMTMDDLPEYYKAAQWHFHPLEFVRVMRKCYWIQKSDLKRIFTEITNPHLEAVRNELNRFSSKHFINTGLRQAHFFGQIRKETGEGMNATTENLNYLPSVLIGKFSYYRNNPIEAQQDGRTTAHAANQQAIANKAYGRDSNDQPGDGWRYRGRGMKQVTWKENYRMFTKEYRTYWVTNPQDFLANPDFLIQMPYSLRSAVWFWVSKGCMKKADEGVRDSDVDAVTRIVNSGEVGTSAGQERRNFTQDAYKKLE